MDDNRKFDLATLLGFCVLLIVFAIGVFLQIKIIKALKQDRTTAWEIQLTHSIVMLVHFSLVIIFESTIYFVPTLDTYLGKLFCSATFILRMLGAGEMIIHSLIISFYKYIFIVHHNMVLDIGIDRMKRILRFVYLLLLVGGPISYIFRPNFRAFNLIHNCGVKQVQNEADLPHRLFMCGMIDLKYDDGYDYFMNILTGLFCSIQTIISMLLYLNILECIFYICIFRHMRR